MKRRDPVRTAARAARLALLLASLAACRFGGPSGSPLTYVPLGDDAGAADAATNEAFDASLSEGSVQDAATTDAPTSDAPENASTTDAAVEDGAPVDAAPVDAPTGTDASSPPETSIEGGSDLG